MSGPPQEWLSVAFEDAFEVVPDGGKRLPQSEYQEKGRLPVIDQGERFVGGFTDREELAFSGSLPILIFGDHTRRVKYVKEPFVVGAQGVKLLRPRDTLDPLFAYYLLKATRLPDRGYSRHFQFLKKRTFALPSLHQQRAIVPLIEEQLTRIEEGVGSLHAAARGCRQMRRSVLHAAFSGEVRGPANNGHEAEERTSPAHPKDAPPPGRWTTRPLSELVDIFDSRRIPVNREERARRPGKVPYYGATGQVGWIGTPLFDEELLLLGEDGAPFLEAAAQKAYIIAGQSWVNNHAHVLRARQEVTSNKYLLHYLNYFDYHGYVTGTTRLKLTQAEMRRMRIRVPPRIEQDTIVEEIDRQLSILDSIVVAIEEGRARAERLVGRILVDAFVGKLAAQESASELTGESVSRVPETRAVM